MDVTRANDVVVIGGGPAGAWTAYCLARRGVRVRILDASHPREKPCGGGITGRALALVDAALSAETLPQVQVASARFIDTPARRSATVALTHNHSSLVVASRAAFDARLLAAAQRAGAELLPVRATDVRPHASGGFRIQLAAARAPLSAAIVIGADGAAGLVRRRFTQPFTREQLSIATGYFVHGVTSAEIVIELMSDPAGYLWSFPRPDHLAVGICAQADAGITVGALRDRAAQWIDSTGLGPGAALEPYAWPIPSLSASAFRAAAVAGPGWFLVGDAAGLVDPITREGIFFALQSAEAAAAAIAASAAGGPAAHLTYARHMQSGVIGELTRAARFKATFFRPRFAHLLMDGLVSSPAIRSVMADLVAGTQSYEGLKWRLAKTFELRLALKALSVLGRG